MKRNVTGFKDPYSPDHINAIVLLTRASYSFNNDNGDQNISFSVAIFKSQEALDAGSRPIDTKSGIVPVVKGKDIETTVFDHVSTLEGFEGLATE